MRLSYSWGRGRYICECRIHKKIHFPHFWQLCMTRDEKSSLDNKHTIVLRTANFLLKLRHIRTSALKEKNLNYKSYLIFVKADCLVLRHLFLSKTYILQSPTYLCIFSIKYKLYLKLGNQYQCSMYLNFCDTLLLR